MDRHAAHKGLSAIQEQHDIIIQTIKNITQDDWKVLVLDNNSQKMLGNVVKDDELLNNNIANIEQIEERREPNPDMDAIYILSPRPHIVDCLMADLDRRRYRGAHLIWTAVLDTQLRRRLEMMPDYGQIKGFQTLAIDFYPRESHLITFRDPWSFPVLFHPACNNLVAAHMQVLAQKIAGVCITLGEYPQVRYYRPKDASHEASVLCSHLARFVQDEVDAYGRWNRDFPPPTSRPQGVLIITDRSMDLIAPLVHEFTYQAMAHDLLPIQDGEKVTFCMKINEGTPAEEEKDMELAEKDEVWVKNRHRHMKDTIEKLMGDFQHFLKQNPNFTDDRDATSLNAIKDMLAGLPQFQEMKEAYSLHLSMAQESMNMFQQHKLPDIASVEQTLATHLDEDDKKPKNVLDQVVRLLDDEAVSPTDRLRLMLLFIMYRDGVIGEDIKRLLAHANLHPGDGEVVTNLELLGAKTTRATLKEVYTPPAPLFPRRTPNPNRDEYALSRFETNVKHMLNDLCTGTLNQSVFPYVKPPMEPDGGLATQGSLRAAKPRWAGAGRREAENRQRIVVFVAGGATFSEARACYEASDDHRRDVFLATSHMLTPQLFLRQMGDLSVDRRRLDLPMDRPKPKAPAHLFERAAPPALQGMGMPDIKLPGTGMSPAQGGRQRSGTGRAAASGGVSIPVSPRPPTQQMANMSLGGGAGRPPPRPPASANGLAHQWPDSTATRPPSVGGERPPKPEKEKKKRFLGLRK